MASALDLLKKVGYIFIHWNNIVDKPTTFPPSAHTHSGSDITSKVASASTADSVDWNGITNKPTSFTPSPHKSTHAINGSDPIAPTDIGAATASDLNNHMSVTIQQGAHGGINPSFFIEGNYNFTRSSVAYKSDGTQVTANIPRFEQGQFGKAIMIEEGTTNLCTNPSFETYTGSNGVANSWNFAYNSTVTYAYSVDTTTYFTGTKSQKIVISTSTGAGDAIIFQGFSGTVGTTYTLSAYAKGSATGTGIAFIRFWFSDSSGNLIAAPTNTFVLTSTWQRVVLTATVPTNTATMHIDLGIRAQTAGDTVTAYFDDVQLETKSYATSYTDSTRSPETLTIPTAGVLNPQEGTVESWVYVPEFWKQGIPNWRRIWGIGRDAGAGMYVLRFDPGTGKMFFSIWDDTGTAHEIFTDKPSIGWHYFATKWSATEMALFIDGIKVGYVSNPVLPTRFADTVLSIGCRSDSYDEINTLIDDFRISNRARTDNEILAAYQSGQPLLPDKDTTWWSGFSRDVLTVAGNTVWHAGNDGAGSGLDADMVDGLHASDLKIPIGTIIWFAASTPPPGFLVCNGAAISRTTYANLFAVIGTTFGAGDNSTTFNLPDLRGVFVRGWDNGRGIDPNRTFGTLQQASYVKQSSGSLLESIANTDPDIGSGSGAAYSAGSGTSFTYTLKPVRPVNIALLPCIKY